MKRKVISRDNIRVKFPICGTAVIYLLLDKWHSPGWVYGVFFTIMALVFLSVIYDAFHSESVDIFTPSNVKGGEKIVARDWYGESIERK